MPINLSRKSEPKTPRIIKGEYAPELDRLYTSWVNELYQDADLPSLIDLVKMFRYCPINRVAIELKSI